MSFASMEYWLLVVPTIIALSLHAEYISVLTSLEHDVVEYNMMEKVAANLHAQ